MTSQPLEYGSQPRVNPGRMIRRSLAVLALVAVCVWTIRLGFQRLYNIDYDSVESALGAVPGGRVIDISGFGEELTQTVASATVSVDGLATRTVTFMSPGRGQLQSGSRMAVTDIGPYQIRVEVSDDRMLVQSLDFGHDSEFKDVLPLRLRDVNDLAAHYDEIIAFITQEPSGTYTAPDAKVVTYQIQVWTGPRPPPWRLR